MIKPVHTDQLSLNDLQAYLDGRLNDKARHRVERILLEQPFYADALDGLKALQQNGASLNEQTASLRAALQERIHESASERRLLPLWLTAATACIVLVLSVAIYLIFVVQQPAPRPVQPKQTKVVEVELTPLDSLKGKKDDKERKKADE
ncbi:hypothetical protein GCM10023189_01690 [Nibrella saemangeumensis]|uniref:Uncharacterized protein n=1 Tax=Nibrella saemangeumensis TaxID=1084526 RepID=A0ABP8MCR7_9BACT